MNELLTAMSSDMGINRYRDESNESYIYRLCYSALGLWCLQIAQNGTTKHNQTIVMNELLQRYFELFPGIADKFAHADNPLVSLLVHFRKVYEETGYLKKDKGSPHASSLFGS